MVMQTCPQFPGPLTQHSCHSSTLAAATPRSATPVHLTRGRRRQPAAPGHLTMFSPAFSDHILSTRALSGVWPVHRFTWAQTREEPLHSIRILPATRAVRLPLPAPAMRLPAFTWAPRPPLTWRTTTALPN